ncbi:helix-turn-helix domain-containing protein [Acutalibacter caecimuris]|uniref:helix-turn-helix domain-containing protein n=1 Tax=Acutalibacter caecimuris TaxID=3093657 RepID=UPI002AC97590|nr:helix-turn-helix transcriptional regulator [Acutalibacter sp. M00118]
MTTGQLIKEARKKAGMTQSELAQKLNVPFQSISQWERGLRNPKNDTLKRVATALGVDWVSLTEENDSNATHMIWDELRKEMLKSDPLTDEETALKTLLNSIGYDLIKLDGRYRFRYDDGFSVMTEDDLHELLSCAKNGLKVAAKTLELKLLQRDLPPNIHIEQPLQCPSPEDSETIPESGESPPEGPTEQN